MPIELREPLVVDAAALGPIHVRAWQAGYRGGLIPDDYLDSMTVEERTETWRGWLGRRPQAGFWLVAEVTVVWPDLPWAAPNPDRKRLVAGSSTP